MAAQPCGIVMDALGGERQQGVKAPPSFKRLRHWGGGAWEFTVFMVNSCSTIHVLARRMVTIQATPGARVAICVL